MDSVFVLRILVSFISSIYALDFIKKSRSFVMILRLELVVLSWKDENP